MTDFFMISESSCPIVNEVFLLFFRGGMLGDVVELGSDWCTEHWKDPYR
jgi:hypothetical protein